MHSSQHWLSVLTPLYQDCFRKTISIDQCVSSSAVLFIQCSSKEKDLKPMHNALRNPLHPRGREGGGSLCCQLWRFPIHQQSLYSSHTLAALVTIQDRVASHSLFMVSWVVKRGGRLLIDRILSLQAKKIFNQSHTLLQPQNTFVIPISDFI